MQQDPEKWLADYQARMKGLFAKASQVQEDLASANATVSSRDGSVTVTLNPNGGLENLVLGHRACDLGPSKLTALVMETVRRAQVEVSQKVRDAVAPITVEGSETAELIFGSMPEDVELDESEAAAPAPAPVPAATRPRRAPVDDEVYEDRPW